MNPLKYLSPALYATLAAAGLSYEGRAVPVARALEGNEAGHYVLLHQPTATELPGSKSCRQWTCTQLVDVITQFASDAVSIEPADDIAEQVLDVLDAGPLALPGRWQCSPAVLGLASELQEDNNDQKRVRRLVRLRWTVSYNA